MKTGDNVRLRRDGRYEARYIKSRDENGKIIYGCCYGQTYEEAVEKRNYQLKKLNPPKTKQMNLLILGAGGHGEDVYEIARGLRIFNKISFLDDDPTKEYIVGKWSEAKNFLDEYPVAIVAIADGELRKKMTLKLLDMGFIIPTLIHPTAYIPNGVEVGTGSIICARVTVSVGAKIGANCIITSGSIVPRKCNLLDWAYFEVDQWRFNKKNYIIPDNDVGQL